MRKLPLFLSTALLTCAAGTVSADEVGLKTARPVGETLTLALNADLSATLTWSNGENETRTFDGNPVELQIKADSLTITSLSGDITRLYVPSAKLVSLNTSAAPALQKLMCADNELKTLSLTRNTKLEELDCSGNQLKALTLTNNRSIAELNCADNAIATLTCSSAGVSKMQTFVCSANQLDTIRYQSNMTALRTLWAAGNELRTINPTRATQLRSVLAANNGLEFLQLPASAVFTDLWAEHNHLAAADLSGVTTGLMAVSLNDNKLSSITWGNRATKLTDFYAHNNKLFFNAFPLLNNTDIHFSIAPQDPYPLAPEFIIDTRYNLKSQLGVNGYGTAPVGLQLKLHNAAGDELVKGTTGDYVLQNGNWTFKTEQRGAYITAAAERAYPGVELRTEPFNILFTTGIHDATTGADLSLSTAAGSLSVSVARPTAVTIVSASGITVAREYLNAGTRNWQLPAGLYVVNGRKALVK